MPTSLPLPLDQNARIAACHDLYARAPIFADLGIDPPTLDIESCSLRWMFGPAHEGMNLTLHGGMICVLADSLSAFIVTMATGIPTMTTTDLTVQYLRAMHAPVIATGRVIKAGRTFATVQVEVAEEGRPIGALVILKLLLLRD